MVYPNIQYRGPGYPDLDPSTTSAGARELDTRTSDGIRVRLLWHQADGHVSVTVEETQSGVIFDLPVRDGERALDVFHHPYAYAAIRRLGNNADDEAPLRVHAAHGGGSR
jgi:hypothetical protein